MTIKLEWRNTTDFGYRYAFYMGDVRVGYIGQLANEPEPGTPKWFAGTGLPIPYYPHGAFLGHFHSIAFAKAEVEGAVDHFLMMTGLKEAFQ